jgi:hypothetical protein
MSGFEAISPAPDGFVLRLGPDERTVVVRLLEELRALLAGSDDDANAATPALVRLFPVVHPENPEREAEYQHLMRDELLASRIAAIDVVTGVLTADGAESRPVVTLSEEQLVTLMQAVNGVRLVLGTVLGVSEDDTAADTTGALAPEYHLYAYLSWLLDSAVDALSG